MTATLSPPTTTDDRAPYCAADGGFLAHLAPVGWVHIGQCEDCPDAGPCEYAADAHGRHCLAPAPAACRHCEGPADLNAACPYGAVHCCGCCAPESVDYDR